MVAAQSASVTDTASGYQAAADPLADCQLYTETCVLCAETSLAFLLVVVLLCWLTQSLNMDEWVVAKKLNDL